MSAAHNEESNELRIILLAALNQASEMAVIVELGKLMRKRAEQFDAEGKAKQARLCYILSNRLEQMP